MAGFGSEGFGGLDNLSARDVDNLHRNADVDQSRQALHHTLGKRPNQAAPGNELEALRESVENSRGGVDDRSWSSLTIPTGSGSARWCCYNGRVEVEVTIENATIPIGSSGTIVATGIPSSYAPLRAVYGLANVGGENAGQGAINPLGQVRALVKEAATVFRFRHSYRVG